MNNITLYVIGDSTACDYTPKEAPRAGWGQVIGTFLSDDITVSNHASSGRSTKSFIDEQRFVPVAQNIEAGDYLLIQFGHNDEKDDPLRHTDPFTSFTDNLTLFVNTALNKGAHPILITPVSRRHFDDNGELLWTHGEYPKAVKSLAQQLNIPCIDLELLSRELFIKEGVEGTKKTLLWLEPGESDNYTEGVQDNTHFQETGAKKIARLIVDEIKAQNLPLKAYIRV